MIRKRHVRVIRFEELSQTRSEQTRRIVLFDAGPQCGAPPALLGRPARAVARGNDPDARAELLQLPDRYPSTEVSPTTVTPLEIITARAPFFLFSAEQPLADLWFMCSRRFHTLWTCPSVECLK